jgi:hypothetical protein
LGASFIFEGLQRIDKVRGQDLEYISQDRLNQKTHIQVHINSFATNVTMHVMLTHLFGNDCSDIRIKMRDISLRLQKLVAQLNPKL